MHLDQVNVVVYDTPLLPHIVASKEAILRLPVAIHRNLDILAFWLLKDCVVEKLHKHVQ